MPKSRIVQFLMSQFDEFKSWPRWKQRILAHQLYHILRRQPSNKFDHNSQQLPTSHNFTSSIVYSTKTNKLSTEFTMAMKNVVEDLRHKFLSITKDHPNLNLETFVNNLAHLKSLPDSLRHKLIMALQESLKSRYCKYHYLEVYVHVPNTIR